MTRAVLVAILILFSISSVNFVDSLIQENLGKFLWTFGAVKQYIIVHIVVLNAKENKKNESISRCVTMWLSFSRVRIPDLLNQLCNQSQGSNAAMRRDACYGCFFRASILPQGYPMLLAMSTCADTYLNNTSYGHCQAYLRVRARNVHSSSLIYAFRNSPNTNFTIRRVPIFRSL